jgi:hypothetical protein
VATRPRRLSRTVALAPEGGLASLSPLTGMPVKVIQAAARPPRYLRVLTPAGTGGGRRRLCPRLPALVLGARVRLDSAGGLRQRCQILADHGMLRMETCLSQAFAATEAE